jgi:antitoxin CptB
MGEGSALRWRCRRGMKELDLLLARYLEKQYARSSAEERAAFAALLERPDPELADYCFGRKTPGEAAARRVVAAIRDTGGSC